MLSLRNVVDNMSCEIRDYTEFFGLKQPVSETAYAIKESIADIGFFVDEERILTAACVVLALRKTKYSFQTQQIANYAGVTNTNLKMAMGLVEKRVKMGENNANTMG